MDTFNHKSTHANYKKKVFYLWASYCTREAGQFLNCRTQRSQIFLNYNYDVKI